MPFNPFASAATIRRWTRAYLRFEDAVNPSSCSRLRIQVLSSEKIPLDATDLQGADQIFMVPDKQWNCQAQFTIGIST